MKILVINTGSSTLKFRVLELSGADEERPRRIVDGLVDRWGSAKASLRLSIDGGAPTLEPVAVESAADAAEHAIRVCSGHGIDAVGYRIVHGGPRFITPTLITPDVIQGIEEISSLAPLHNRHALQAIEAGRKLLPTIPAGAVFDTAFHHTMPEVAARYAIPLDLAEKHALRRYGFHGISHEYVSSRLLQCIGKPTPGSRLITCHLGNGASVCAIRDGKSIDTSMGLTPAEGLIMGSRSGDIDPGLVLHLITALGMSAEEAGTMLNHRSGLLGLSGRSSDVRNLEQAAAGGDALAEAALEAFAYRVRKYIGAYAAALGGVDAIGLSGGIGEHSQGMRSRIAGGLGCFNIAIDADENRRPADGARPWRISAADRSPQVWVVPTDEESAIARKLYALLSGSAG